jgi:hypothetical protein
MLAIILSLEIIVKLEISLGKSMWYMTSKKNRERDRKTLFGIKMPEINLTNLTNL